MNGNNNIFVYNLLFKYALVIPYHVLINYVVYRKFPPKEFPCTSKSIVKIRAS